MDDRAAGRGHARAAAVTFPEPLDHGLLLRALGVLSPDGKPLRRRRRGRRARADLVVHAAEPWQAGDYKIVAFAMLEDLAGNRIGRAFEVDQFDRTDSSAEPEKTLIPFSVKYNVKTEAQKHRSTEASFDDPEKRSVLR